MLGLRGEVTQEHFEAIREGLNPETGEFLRPRHSADRAKDDGSEQSKGRSLYDLTFSAPKSISIQALVGGDDRLVAAHDKAVREALAEAESHAATRVRLNGANENRATGNWIVASYRHDTSRELDPQLHTHAVAANLTYDGVEGRWKALQAGLANLEASLDVRMKAEQKAYTHNRKSLDTVTDLKGRFKALKVKAKAYAERGMMLAAALPGIQSNIDNVLNQTQIDVQMLERLVSAYDTALLATSRNK